MKPFKTQKGFYKILLMFVVAISIPAVSIGYLTIRSSTTHIIKQVDLSSNVLLVEKKQYIEQMMSDAREADSGIGKCSCQSVL
ncbi:hypothetical protein [Paenibacillus cymbidii]|uniref:hypothetical protein n=1 Tax=Paenibacillus cymbidii TaxID=1639034 RepID=UPI001080196E|nr:hypothetical protein [Paenibacillus cymbidii]